MIDPALKKAVVTRVAALFGITPQSLVGRERTATVALARQDAMVVLLNHGGFSTVEIGRAFFRDGDTVRHAARIVEHHRRSGPSVTRHKLAALLDDPAGMGGLSLVPAAV